MENQQSDLLSWAYFCQGKTVEDLNHFLFCMTLELEHTNGNAQEELRKRDDQLIHLNDLLNKAIKERDDQLIHLKDLLNKAIKERDEAEEKCQRLFLEKLLLEQTQQEQTVPLSGTSSIEDEPIRGIDSYNSFWPSDCEGSIVSSPVIDPNGTNPLPPKTQLPQPAISQLSLADESLALVSDKPLPAKGMLLQAVVKAGPLLQTLLVAGPLPQWKSPPPPIESFEIPPVTIPSQLREMPLHDSLINITNCGRINRKRVHFDGSEPLSKVKYQRVVLH